MSPSCAFYFEEELLSLFHTSLIFHIRQSRHDNAAEVRVPGYYSLGRRCPCLCYFASMWEIKRRNCSFIDQLPLKATCPGQTRSFLTFFFFTVNSNQTLSWPQAACPQNTSGSCFSLCSPGHLSQISCKDHGNSCSKRALTPARYWSKG